ncbi:DUF3445 domain-containing protein [Parvularcula sp. LCG005]|uniref:heme-dependent oxidative N-demethylase family protein n=1 Tax=Parvularcula sp. LCG005 TaxID=3078805 RepID=UPI002942BD6E|nr:DUF3445 domain-containing protein [Parvularcula sp. LCG005]WOI54667.1 DUF3445 domain-containing protein [Parvularcula sp. LCG005]
MTPIYTPYRNGFAGFQIALNRMEEAGWIELDSHLADRLAEKDALFAGKLDTVFQATHQSLPAQEEVWSLLTAYLVEHFPDDYVRSDGDIVLTRQDRCVRYDPLRPLLSASRLIDEDLCLMIRHDDGWRLDAASLCFPSHWSLADKFEQPMLRIHAPVPGFADRMAARVERIFDHLKPEQPVWRLNWSLHDEPTLHLPNLPHAPRFMGMSDQSILANAFMRIERQSLRKLPRSNAIVFAIKTYVDPLHALERAEPQLLSDIASAIRSMDKDQIAYKGLGPAQENVVQALEERQKAVTAR